jgi:hypothetical protein
MHNTFFVATEMFLQYGVWTSTARVSVLFLYRIFLCRITPILLGSSVEWQKSEEVAVLRELYRVLANGKFSWTMEVDLELSGV